jgi:hypothetical protein
MSYYARPMPSSRGEEKGQAPSTSRCANIEDADMKEKRTINQLLKIALKEAANAGFGDEEPEVMKASSEGNGKNPVDNHEQQTRRQAEKIADERRKAMDEEEKKVAEMTFDPDALHPTQDIRERAKYIPLRLSYEERKSLRLINAAISVSDYTTAVDVIFKSKAKRHHTQLQHIVAFLTGIIAADDHENGQTVLGDRNFIPYEKLIQDALEIARRYKITNPEKMRSEYGKLVFLIQDAVSKDTRPLLGINIKVPVKTVYSLLESRGGLALLDDPHIATATEEILPDKFKNRSNIQLEIRRKERAADFLCSKYLSSKLSKDDIKLCLYSISDNNSFLNSNRKPIIQLVELLKGNFLPGKESLGNSLSIDVGLDGARLSHSHELQYNYVLQSLELWSAIVEDMFRLWYLAELDLLSDTQPYELRNTGQGLQRVQLSPRVYKAMHDILARTQQTVHWVGSSVIHLGDHNVPNTLVFIDKYTQVSRILGPLLLTLINLESACEESEGLGRYMEAYGGIEKAKKDILLDFFMHAFDGSGGDNNFDAGSCIDGRLTSAWNWCSQLSSKPYYSLFRLTGFLSFDGQFD